MDDLKRDINDLRRDVTEFPEHNTARDEKIDLDEQERILQDNIIGVKTTAEGTASADGGHAPTGDVAPEKTPPRQ